MRYVIEVDCENEQDKYILLCCEQDIRNKLEGERDSLRITVANLQAENGWLTSRLLRAGCVVQHDGSFFLEDVPEMLAREFDLLKQENERLRKTRADATRIDQRRRARLRAVREESVDRRLHYAE